MAERKYRYYVTMTDRALSGWGGAQGRTAKLVIGTDDYDEARQLASAAERRGEMKYVNINTTRPRYDSRRYQVSFRDSSDMSGSWRS
jgi:hypothetical protein